ncbi:F-box and associated interaction domains-containing protein [Prunus dulcis]|uniref:F-box and associated interaction domains-containing protein n=1 Tax=Prunus dulcis TaxID=3755 RepID=A0A4Y1RNS7_PRUDU|nr:F-box and associated interaction domains-containing protein [Prunus dulcis]
MPCLKRKMMTASSDHSIKHFPTGSKLRSLRSGPPSSGIGDNSWVRNLRFPLKQPDLNPTVKVILGSCNGLICVALAFNQHFYIWNPSTGFLQKLPDPDFGSQNIKTLDSYGFGYVSAADDYKVIVAVRPTQTSNRGGLSQLVAPFLSIQAHVIYIKQKRGTLSNEALHWLPWGGGPVVIAFDLAKVEFREITNHVNPAFEKWMDRDKSVRAWLDSRISEDLLPYTVGAYSSHALWMILEKQFVGASSCHFDLGDLESTGEEVGLFFSKLSAVVGSSLSPEVTTNSFSTKAIYS